MSNEIKDFFKTYSDFVTKVTSDPSLDLDALMERLKEIDASSDIKSARLLTAAMGLGSETGEFVEIVKKMYLQGKPASEENINGVGPFFPTAVLSENEKFFQEFL